MIALIQNELQKIFRVKTLVAVGLVLLITTISIGYISANVIVDTEEDINLAWEERYQSQIDDYTYKLNNDSQNQIDPDTRLQMKTAIEYNEFSLEHGISPGDWRSSLLSIYFEYKYIPGAEEAAEQYKAIVLENDWKAYYHTLDEDLRAQQKNFPENSYGYQSLALDLTIHALRYQYDIEPSFGSVDWKNNLLSEYKMNEDSVLRNTYYIDSVPANEIKNLQNENRVILYRLEHNIPEYNVCSFSASMVNSIYTTTIALILLVIVAALNMVNEYHYMTIRRLFTFPYHRYKIFLAKCVALIVFALLAINMSYIFALLSNVMFFNFENPYVVYTLTDTVYDLPLLAFVWIKYNIAIIEVTMYLLITFLLAVLIRNIGISVGVPVALLGIKWTLMRYLSQHYYLPFLRYIPIASYDFNQFFGGSILVQGVTMPLAIIITVISTNALLFITLFCFQKQEM